MFKGIDSFPIFVILREDSENKSTVDDLMRLAEFEEKDIISVQPHIAADTKTLI